MKSTKFHCLVFDEKMYIQNNGFDGLVNYKKQLPI